MEFIQTVTILLMNVQKVVVSTLPHLAKMKEDPKVNLMSQEGLNIGYLAFNVRKKPFDDVKVRQALNMAVNKAAIIDAIYQGAGKAAKNPIPPTIWSYNDKVEDYAYDPEKAKALLKEAGFENGFETDIWAMPVQRPYNPNARRMAEMIQADWAAVGVKAQIVSYEWGEYLKRAQAGSIRPCCWAGRATMATPTTSWRCCWAAMRPMAAPTMPAGATSPSTT